MRIVNPVGTSAAQSKSLAARPSSLEGVTIALLDNSKPNAAVLLERAAALLRERTGARAVMAYCKPAASMGATPALLQEIAATARVALTASVD